VGIRGCGDLRMWGFSIKKNTFHIKKKPQYLISDYISAIPDFP
jgi:hypothetical protein